MGYCHLVVCVTDLGLGWVWLHTSNMVVVVAGYFNCKILVVGMWFREKLEFPFTWGQLGDILSASKGV